MYSDDNVTILILADAFFAGNRRAILAGAGYDKSNSAAAQMLSIA
jgi:hypothetical protein